MVKRAEARLTGICPNDTRTKSAFELTSSRYPTIHLSKSISASVADNFRCLRRDSPVTGEGDHIVVRSSVKGVLRNFSDLSKTCLTAKFPSSYRQ